MLLDRASRGWREDYPWPIKHTVECSSSSIAPSLCYLFLSTMVTPPLQSLISMLPPFDSIRIHFIGISILLWRCISLDTSRKEGHQPQHVKKRERRRVPSSSLPPMERIQCPHLLVSSLGRNINLPCWAVKLGDVDEAESLGEETRTRRMQCI